MAPRASTTGAARCRRTERCGLVAPGRSARASRAQGCGEAALRGLSLTLHGSSTFPSSLCGESTLCLRDLILPDQNLKGCASTVLSDSHGASCSRPVAASRAYGLSLCVSETQGNL